MKNRTKYQEEKTNALNALREYAKEIKGTDSKTTIRCAINDMAEHLRRDTPYSLEEWQRERISSALSNLACKLHPKG